MTDAMPAWAADLTSPLDDKLGLVVESVTAEVATCRVPVAGNTQPFGAWHGGATCVVFETLASVASYAHARERGKIAVGVEINATHLSGATDGWLHGRAEADRLGGQLATYRCELRDDTDRLIAVGRVTCFLRDGAPRQASSEEPSPS